LLHPLRADGKFENCKASDIASRMSEAGNKSGAHRIGNLREYHRYGAGRALYFSQSASRRRQNHVWIQGHQFCRIGPQSLEVSATPTVIDSQVAAFDPSVLQQT
jgi:hypothetical protein